MRRSAAHTSGPPLPPSNGRIRPKAPGNRGPWPLPLSAPGAGVDNHDAAPDFVSGVHSLQIRAHLCGSLMSEPLVLFQSPRDDTPECRGHIHVLLYLRPRFAIQNRVEDDCSCTARRRVRRPVAMSDNTTPNE